MATATLIPAPSAGAKPADVIAYQRECMQASQYEVLGKIWMLNFEAAAQAQVPNRSVAQMIGTRLEWYSAIGGTQVFGPRIAQTGPRGSLLILDPIVSRECQNCTGKQISNGAVHKLRYLGDICPLCGQVSPKFVVGLPHIPDPQWVPPIPTDDQISWSPPPPPRNRDGSIKKNYKPPKAPDFSKPAQAPMVPQNLVDHKDGFGGRARGKIIAGNTTYLVCGPVVQITVRPLDKENRILPQGLLFKCLPSTPMPGLNSTLMELLIDTATGEAFLFGGRFEIGNPG